MILFNSSLSVWRDKRARVCKSPLYDRVVVVVVVVYTTCSNRLMYTYDNDINIIINIKYYNIINKYP